MGPDISLSCGLLYESRHDVQSAPGDIGEPLSLYKQLNILAVTHPRL